MPAKQKRGLKRPPQEELTEIIRLTNLLPANPPPLPLTVERANSLPSDLRKYLEDVRVAEMERGEDAHTAWQIMEWEFMEIRDAREALCDLMRQATEVSDEETFYFHEPIDARAYLSITHGTVEVAKSRLAHAIEGAEIDYLRNCQICSRIFYAGRRNQHCCTPKCAKAQRQKRWREKYANGESAYYK